MSAISSHTHSEIIKNLPNLLEKWRQRHLQLKCCLSSNMRVCMCSYSPQCTVLNLVQCFDYVANTKIKNTQTDDLNHIKLGPAPISPIMWLKYYYDRIVGSRREIQSKHSIDWTLGSTLIYLSVYQLVVYHLIQTTVSEHDDKVFHAILTFCLCVANFRLLQSPILEIASHFTSRSSRISLQRSKKFVLFFRISFAFQMLALILWLVAVCIISKTIAVGAQFLLLSGLSQVMSCTLIAFIPEMIIHLPGMFLSS